MGKAALAGFLIVSSCSPETTGWQLGPIINGHNYSKGATLSQAADGWVIDIPQSDGVHYVTEPGPLTSKQRMVLRYRVEGKIVPVSDPSAPSMLSLYFQRCGDDWSGAGKYEAYRWFSPERDMPISPGEHEISASLNDNWAAVQSSSALSNPTAFAAAKNDTCRIGFVLGGGTGRGHGVYAIGPARLTIESFTVQ
jgi:hypothetical protein